MSNKLETLFLQELLEVVGDVILRELALCRERKVDLLRPGNIL